MKGKNTMSNLRESLFASQVQLAYRNMEGVLSTKTALAYKEDADHFYVLDFDKTIEKELKFKTFKKEGIKYQNQAFKIPPVVKVLYTKNDGTEEKYNLQFLGLVDKGKNVLVLVEKKNKDDDPIKRFNVQGVKVLLADNVG